MNDDLVQRSEISDARLTAYALDELSEIERTKMQAELERSPELRCEIEAIQDVAAQLRMEFALASVDTADLRFQKLSVPAREQPLVRIRNSRPVMTLAIAASLTLAAGWGLWQNSTDGIKNRVRHSAAATVAIQVLPAGRIAPSSSLYDLPNEEWREAIGSESPRLTYDDPVRVATLNDGFLNFSVSYHRAF
jgi:anti-sigma factor RsiW